MIVDEFKKLWSNQVPDSGMLVPLLRWCSGKESNLTSIQMINERFKYTEKDILTRSLALNNSLNHFIKFPKVDKEDEKIEFFLNDICTYYGWTRRELQKNMNIVDLEALKPIISVKFGYDNFQRKAIGLKKIKGLK